MIKTPRFHLVEGQAEPKLQAVVTHSNLALPPAYKEFVLKFGNAKLYRKSRTSYRIGIFAGPREAMLNDGTRIYHLGFSDGASVYVKPQIESQLLPIFEYEDRFEDMVAGDFEEWLSESCDFARSKYGKTEWRSIVRGPDPFNPEEEQVIEARRMVRWRALGIDTEGNHIFEITNESDRSLPFITIGVRSITGKLNGAVRLNIGDVGPGQTAILHKDCYKDLVPPNDVQTFALPDPQPEDRDYYYEFEGLH